ncbi:MAG: hypothetical protein K2M56_06140 [Muribaculaceae bacterium]|nr:hypothetical protein [Muribaculaceae bacterium]
MQASISTAYMWSFIIMVVFFAIAVVVANMVVFKPRDPGTTTRRVWFWVLCVATGVVAFIVNSTIAAGITVPTIKDSYILHSVIAAVVAVVVYIILGFSISKMFPGKKVGTWF